MALKILLTRLSSLGDVVHNLPVLHDIMVHEPAAQIDWLVDETCAPMLHYCQHLHRVIPFPLRAWRKSPRRFLRGEQSLLAWRERMTSGAPYDLCIDLQGLTKSALAQRLFPARLRVGMKNRTEGSSFEPFAKCFYDQKIALPFHSHAVARARHLVAEVLGYRITDAPQCDFSAIPAPVHPHLSEPYAVFLHGTSRAVKQWPFAHWQELGRDLLARGDRVLLPHSNAREFLQAEALAQVWRAKFGDEEEGAPRVLVLPRVSLIEMQSYLAHAAVVVGVDSGLTHWASAYGRPTVQLYCGDAIRWRTEWSWLTSSAHLGETDQVPSVAEVFAALEQVS